MKYETATVLIAFFGLSFAAPAPKRIPARMLRGREVPQEHSHEKFLTSVRTSLNLDNPEGIKDVVFGLLEMPPLQTTVELSPTSTVVIKPLLIGHFPTRRRLEMSRLKQMH